MDPISDDNGKKVKFKKKIKQTQASVEWQNLSESRVISINFDGFFFVWKAGIVQN